MINGPVVGGFSVFANLYGGNFLCQGDNPDNIYLENINYEKGIYEKNTSTIQGGHAVVIIGWGSCSKWMVEISGIDIPYWIVRNSWGTEFKVVFVWLSIPLIRPVNLIRQSLSKKPCLMIRPVNTWYGKSQLEGFSCLISIILDMKHHP